MFDLVALRLGQGALMVHSPPRFDATYIWWHLGLVKVH